MVVAIIAVLAAVAIPAYRDNTRRARMSEVVLAASPCRLAVSDGWLKEASSPGAGNWGCESASQTTRFVGKVQTTVNGEVRVQVSNLDGTLDGLYVYLKPYETAVIPASGGGVFAAGQVIKSWQCGVADSDAASQALLPFLPHSCRKVIDMSGAWLP